MQIRTILPVVFALAALTIGCGRNPYDNPIANNSQQPDKILFDQAIENIEKHRYELGRLTLQTLMNTYPDSEYMAKAKLAVADSWYREGTSHALAQAEAEYKDFITFYPSMEEAAESQKKVCDIHYEQMVKPDRDNTHAVRADQECRQLLLQWPNSVFVDSTKQRLREIQEVLAEAEYRVGMFYTDKGSYRSGANRLQTMADHYPLFSRNDAALWELGNAYSRMGEQFTEQMVDAYTRIVRDYPLSQYVDDAKAKLTELNRPIPEANAEMAELMRYNLDNQTHKTKMKQALTIFGTSPYLGEAAKAGEPAMTSLMPSTPPGIRTNTSVGVQPSADVSVEPLSDSNSQLDKKPDARMSQEGTQESPGGSPQKPQ
ncbi:MAG: outer membrane protein assembly factor BamD [Bryobacterales bacterium]